MLDQMKRKKISPLYLVLLSTFLAACNNGGSSSTTSPPAPTSCSWVEVGNASSFFDFVGRSPSGIASPILLSPDGKTLYVGGEINYDESSIGLGVASINTESSIAWTPVADSETILAQMDSLTSLAISSDNESLYVGGQYQDGERPVVYVSGSHGNWNQLQNLYSDLGFNARYYRVSSLDFYQNALYASVYSEESSFVASSDNGNAWASVADSQVVFGSMTIYTMLYRDNVLYVAGRNLTTFAPMVYRLNEGIWQDISPESATGLITSLAVSESTIYAGGTNNDYSSGVIFSSPLTQESWALISGNAFQGNGNGWVNSIYVMKDILYAGGYFESYVKSTPTSSINWTAVWDAGDVLDGPIANLVVGEDGTVYADGEFSQKVVKLICETVSQ